MIERLIELSIRHRGVTIVAACLLALCGLFAVATTPMDAVPDLSENQVLVFTDWPGHNPREIDEQVTYPLSLHLQGIEGVRVVRGSSDAGFSLLHLIFEEGIRFETCRARVQERLTLMGDALPTGVTPRLAPDAIPTGQIFWYTVEGPGHDLGRLRDIQDWYLRPQLSSVPGVAEVASVGGFVREYVVELDLAKLQSLGLSPREICEAIEHSQAVLGGNVIHKGNAEFLVHTASGFGARSDTNRSPDEIQRQTLQDLEAVLIPSREGEAAAEPNDGATARREPRPPARAVTLRDISRVTMGPKPRRGVFEKDGNEVVGGVIAMRFGHNPLEVTRAIRRKLTELRAGLPTGVHIVPCYDRTPLIEGAVGTVTGTVIEAMLGATLCVLLVLRHFRTSFIIAATLPLAALMSFVIMSVLRGLGIVDIQTNIMSLSGIAISIGVLVDSSIVMAENAMTHLRREFGDRPVVGDVRPIVLAACRTVGRPIFFSVLIMVISFLPVFALGGIDGKLFRPLAFTKTFALIAVALLSVTLVPALCTICIRGRLRTESDSWIVRSVMEVYRPVLNFLLDHPTVMAWIISVTFLLGVTPIGHDGLFRATLLVALVGTGWIAVGRRKHDARASGATQPTDDSAPPPSLSRWIRASALRILLLPKPYVVQKPDHHRDPTGARLGGVTAECHDENTGGLTPPRSPRVWGTNNATVRTLARASGFCGSLVVIALIAQQTMTPLGTDLRMPLDEGMVMDMPITVPRISVTQSGDDLKARDMLLCRFPEVQMVVGKAGRAESAFDPAPLDMIETMVEFRPREFWPKRKLRLDDAERQARELFAALLAAKLIVQPSDNYVAVTAPRDEPNASRRVVEHSAHHAERDGYVDSYRSNNKQSVNSLEPPADETERRTLLSESVTAALTRCELGLREFAYARNQDFQRRLARELIRSAIEGLTQCWERGGRCTRPLQPGDLSLVQESLSPHLGTHLAMSLEEDDLRTIAEHALKRLEENDLLVDEADGAPPRVSLWNSWSRSLGEMFGRNESTEFSELRSALRRVQRAAWAEHLATLNQELFDRGTQSLTRLLAEELLSRAESVDLRAEEWLEQIAKLRQPKEKGSSRSRETSDRTLTSSATSESSATNETAAGSDQQFAHHGSGRHPPLAVLDPFPVLDALLAEQTQRFAKSVFLWPCERDELAGFGGELDRALQMPGWTNVWTRPIQNRVDMLATGVNTEIGVRVLGRSSEDVVSASEEIAAVLRNVPGAADVIADPIRGKGYLEIIPKRERAAELGVDPRDLWHVIETALGGKPVATVLEGRERHDIRVRCARDAARDEQSIRELPVPCRWQREQQLNGRARLLPSREEHAMPVAESARLEPRPPELDLGFVRLAEVAEVRITEGPATIKSENGRLRNYVRLNVRHRSTFAFLADAKRAVAEQITLPEGTFVEWTGQFEHAERTGRTLMLVTPIVIGLILLILWLTYHDWADTCLMMLAVPGAIAGGVLFQWLFGFRWSVPVAVGYLACFGMATSTGIIMLVYLREALEKRGPLALLTEADLRAAVIEGAVHRLRPKLLTEGTTILGLAPMLWASGVGAEVIRPMAAPVLGGILIADEVIDLFLPVLFYWVRRSRWQRARQATGNLSDDTTEIETSQGGEAATT